MKLRYSPADTNSRQATSIISRSWDVMEIPSAEIPGAVPETLPMEELDLGNRPLPRRIRFSPILPNGSSVDGVFLSEHEPPHLVPGIVLPCGFVASPEQAEETIHPIRSHDGKGKGPGHDGHRPGLGYQ